MNENKMNKKELEEKTFTITFRHIDEDEIALSCISPSNMCAGDFSIPMLTSVQMINDLINDLEENEDDAEYFEGVRAVFDNVVEALNQGHPDMLKTCLCHLLQDRILNETGIAVETENIEDALENGLCDYVLGWLEGKGYVNDEEIYEYNN